jgi:hypothetical protein
MFFSCFFPPDLFFLFLLLLWVACSRLVRVLFSNLTDSDYSFNLWGEGGHDIGDLGSPSGVIGGDGPTGLSSQSLTPPDNESSVCIDRSADEFENFVRQHIGNMEAKIAQLEKRMTAHNGVYRVNHSSDGTEQTPLSTQVHNGSRPDAMDATDCHSEVVREQDPAVMIATTTAHLSDCRAHSDERCTPVQNSTGDEATGHHSKPNRPAYITYVPVHGIVQDPVVLHSSTAVPPHDLPGTSESQPMRSRPDELNMSSGCSISGQPQGSHPWLAQPSESEHSGSTDVQSVGTQSPTIVLASTSAHPSEGNRATELYRLPAGPEGDPRSPGHGGWGGPSGHHPKQPPSNLQPSGSVNQHNDPCVGADNGAFHPSGGHPAAAWDEQVLFLEANRNVALDGRYRPDGQYHPVHYRVNQPPHPPPPPAHLYEGGGSEEDPLMRDLKDLTGRIVKTCFQYAEREAERSPFPQTKDFTVRLVEACFHHAVNEVERSRSRAPSLNRNGLAMRPGVQP